MPRESSLYALFWSPTSHPFGRGILHARREGVENGEPRRESHHVGEQRSFSSREGGEVRSKPQFRGARAQVDAKGSGGGGSLRGVSGDKLDIDEDFVTPISNTGAEIEHLFPNSGDSRAQQEIPAHQEETEVEEITQSQVQNAREKRKGVSSRGKSFSTEEDKVLCSGWLNISMDAVTGTNQSGNGFYRRLHQYFAENCGGNCSRSQNSIQNRWLTIQKAVSRFSAFYSAIERRNESGKNEQDRINEAVRMYQDKEVWNFGHCWDILRHEPKWNDKLLETPTTGRGKTKQPQNAPEDALQTQSVQAESSLPPRPQGRDNAKKRRAKGYAETSSSSPAVEMLQKMHERGQEIEEQDAKQKQELIDMEKERLELQKM